MIQSLNSLFQNRELIRILTRRDFLSRFRGSFGGILWAIFQPLFMLAIYTVVFSKFLGVRFGTDDSTFSFAIYLLCGLLPWNAFSESFSNASTIVRSNSNLVKRVVFPLEVLPVSMTLVSMLQQLIGTALLIPFAWVLSDALSPAILMLPLIWLLEFMFYTGINCLWAGFSVFVPDLKHLTNMLLMAMLFMTPILYPIEAVPVRYRFVIENNPFSYLVQLHREVIIAGNFPNLDIVVKFTLISLATFLLGYFWYIRNKKNFIDFL